MQLPQPNRLFALTLALTVAAPPAAQEEARPSTHRVAIVVFEGVELLDFAGPGEVFSSVHAAGRMPFEVYTVAATKAPLTSQGFVNITPGYTFDDCPDPDVVVVPGGSVPVSDVPLREFVLEAAGAGDLVLSVCNGALVLGAAGLLEGLEATTHHSSLEYLQGMVPSASVYSNRRFVDTGRVITSAGVSAGIDASLHIVDRMYGETVARATADYMEYDWRPKEIAELHAQPGENVRSHAAELLSLLEGKSAEEAVPAYRELAKKGTFDERRTNRIGYMLLNSNRGAEARQVFELNCAAYPASANACDSLAEALEALGHPEEAIAWSKRALERIEALAEGERGALQHVEKAASERIERLEQGKDQSAFVCPPCGMTCDAERYRTAGVCAKPSCGMTLMEAASSASR